jgi:hypothetical protein
MAAWIGTGALVAGAIIGGAAVHVATAMPAPTETCDASSSKMRTTLYFGGGRPNGSVSELEWQLFLRDEVTPRFPSGMTVWDAEGQWRGPDSQITHERTKVLLLMHADTDAARRSVRSVIERYRKSFDQESVLWETSHVCAAF